MHSPLAQLHAQAAPRPPSQPCLARLLRPVCLPAARLCRPPAARARLSRAPATRLPSVRLSRAPARPARPAPLRPAPVFPLSPRPRAQAACAVPACRPLPCTPSSLAQRPAQLPSLSVTIQFCIATQFSYCSPPSHNTGYCIAIQIFLSHVSCNTMPSSLLPAIHLTLLQYNIYIYIYIFSQYKMGSSPSNFLHQPFIIFFFVFLDNIFLYISFISNTWKITKITKNHFFFIFFNTQIN